MPGMAGIIGRKVRGKHENDLKLMIDSMMHEPFYKRGSYVNEERGVYIGWTCHEDSYADCMPAMNEKKDLILIFAGEHFATEPSAQDRRANALIRQYEREGEGFLGRLNGWFSGLLIDLKKSKVILFNDRYGMNRVYYHQGKDEFMFGSEAKSLLKIRPQLRELHMEAVGQLISCNCVLDNRSLFPKISVLPGGAAWSWDKDHQLTKRSFFETEEWECLPSLDEQTFMARLGDTVKTVIPRYFREKKQVGLSLTGGLDSRMIIACLNPAPGELPCYTFGGKKDMLDITIARQVAAVCKQQHSVLRLEPSFFSDFPRLAEKTIYITDGCLDISSTHDMYFNKLARSIAPIRVTGKFGSEVIRDHTMFGASAYEGGVFVPELTKYINGTPTTVGNIKKGHPLSVAVFKDFPWREYNKILVEQSQSVFRSPYMDNELVELMYRAPAGVRSSNHPQRSIIRECNSQLSAITSDRGYGGQTNAVLSKVLELYYYALFKADYTYVYALPHWLTRLDAILMSLNGGRPLVGSSQKFEYYRIWYRRELSGYVKEVLLDPKTNARPYFNSKALKMMVERHTQGTHNYMNDITRAMTLELTCRLLIDN